MNIKGLIKNYDDAYNKIFEAFGEDGNGEWEPIIDNTDCKFYLSEHGDISYIEDECEYGYDYVREVARSDGFILLYVQDNGDKFYAIFDMRKQFSDYEEFDSAVS